jgi:hypothetical protein
VYPLADAQGPLAATVGSPLRSYNRRSQRFWGRLLPHEFCSPPNDLDEHCMGAIVERRLDFAGSGYGTRGGKTPLVATIPPPTRVVASQMRASSATVITISATSRGFHVRGGYRWPKPIPISTSSRTMSAASRAAYNWAAIESPALDIQQSARLTDAVSAEAEVMKMTLKPPGSRGVGFPVSR